MEFELINCSFWMESCLFQPWFHGAFSMEIFLCSPTSLPNYRIDKSRLFKFAGCDYDVFPKTSRAYCYSFFDIHYRNQIANLVRNHDIIGRHPVHYLTQWWQSCVRNFRSTCLQAILAPAILRLNLRPA